MHRNTPALAGSLAVAAIIVGGCLADTGGADSVVNYDPTPLVVTTTQVLTPSWFKVDTAHCDEDQSCWDARTMGNRQAGVGAEHGPVDGQCEDGGTYVPSNEYGKPVCEF